MLKKIGEQLVSGAFAVWLLGMSLAVPYFNWTYARDHGFFAWLFLGEIVATAKAAAWPYYVVSSIDFGAESKAFAKRKADATLVLGKIIVLYRDLGEIAASMKTSGDRNRQDAWDKFMETRTRLLEAGKGLDVDAANAIYPDLGSLVSEKLIPSVDLVRDGLDDPEKRAQVLTMETEVREWWAEHGERALGRIQEIQQREFPTAVSDR